MQDNGIWPPFEAFYIESLIPHTHSAIDSIEKIFLWIKAFENNDVWALQTRPHDVFYELQNILHQAGCVSRYFFPTGRAKKSPHIERATRLRNAMEITDSSPLANRELRNAIEHFDERLDLFLQNDHIGEFFPYDIGYEPRQSDIPTHILKGFYIRNFSFVLLNQNFSLLPIIDELTRIHSILDKCRQSGHRLP